MDDFSLEKCLNSDSSPKDRIIEFIFLNFLANRFLIVAFTIARAASA